MPSQKIERRYSIDLKMVGMEAHDARKIRELIDQIIEIFPSTVVYESHGLIEPDSEMDDFARRARVTLLDGGLGGEEA